MVRNYRIWLLVIWVLIIAGGSGKAWAKEPAASAISELQRKIMPLTGPADSVMVKTPEGSIIVHINGDRLRVPASILKVLTSLAALEAMGERYRFNTDFYLDMQNNLKIKGFGDPLLVSERLQAISAHLASKVRKVNNIVLDDTYFAQPIRIPGRGRSTQPYDAPNGALCVNFNTVAFTREKGRWVSAEPQTPLLSSVLPKIEASGLQSGRITLVADSAETLDYTGQLFEFFLKHNGVSVSGGIQRGLVKPATDRLIWQYRSEANLGQVVSRLLEFSNNFIANQILLVMGARAYGPPATVEKGLTALNTFYRRELGIQSERIVEASGISRENRVSARSMLIILEHFLPYHGYMQSEGRQYYKTGHLKGIRTRAGYIASQKGGFYRFVVMVNTPGKTTHRIMKVLERELE